MNERWVEIEFSFYLTKLMKKFNNDVCILDYIDAICLLGRVNSLVIKKYIRQLREGRGIIVAPMEEVITFARETGMSYRELQRVSGIALSTQLRHKDCKVYVDNNYKTGPDFIEIAKFMDIIHKLKEV